jgi:hypothetical protein
MEINLKIHERGKKNNFFVRRKEATGARLLLAKLFGAAISRNSRRIKYTGENCGGLMFTTEV